MKKFIELLRSGTEEARDSAIECIRTALAPCALDAYPVVASFLFNFSMSRHFFYVDYYYYY